MLNKQKWLCAMLAVSIAPLAGAVTIGDGPIKKHIEQSAIDAGAMSLFEIIEHGRHVLFDDFNEMDGHGDPDRPGINAQGVPTHFNRISGGGDAVSCAHCHTKPLIGGAGDYAQSIYPEFNRPDGVNILGFEGLNVKNSKSLFGAGPKELLGEEMTADLQAIAQAALEEAAATGQPVTSALTSKGTDFGVITALPDGTLDTHGVEGVSHDLVVRPFVSVGAFPNLRTIVVGAMEQHFGIEAEEGFGLDDDGDGVQRELTTGDVTAAVIFQASLFVPSEVQHAEPQRQNAVDKGRVLFQEIGCSGCHTPSLTLNSTIFREQAPGSATAVEFDVAQDGFFPRIKLDSAGRGIVPLYSDLKRHDMGAQLRETLEETERESTQHYLTTPLWGVANTGPWMHDGRARSLTEAILLHGGEAQFARDSFDQLSAKDQDRVVEFLKSLKIVATDLRYVLPTLPLPFIDSATTEELNASLEAATSTEEQSL